MIYSQKELAQIVVEYCVAYKIEHVVISPGSRNAPLTINFTNHPKIKPYSIVDERCAAFFALGIAQQAQKPTVVVCTSGSALLNYYPAVAEAYYSNIPLIVISADRPKRLIDVGDGQTIRQENVFKNHSLFNANLVDHAGYRDSNTALINEAIGVASNQNGPVHINIPFDEPLYKTTKRLCVKNISIQDLRIQEDQKLNLTDFAKVWNESNKKLVLVGTNYPNELLATKLGNLIEDSSVLVFTEANSNVHHLKFINSIDKLIAPLSNAALESLQPEVLITMGGMVVSKKIKQFLRNYPPRAHWHVDSKTALDTFQCLSHHFKVEPASFLDQFLRHRIPVNSSYQKKWFTLKNNRNLKHTAYLDKATFSDLVVFDVILKSIPKNNLLQLANSSIIRYCQLFDLDASLNVCCNRGTSGIDGSTSTAIGAAHVSSTSTVFITGDISFFYDSNALWNSYIKKDFRIVLINNSGGAIFKIIKGPDTSSAMSYFETPHKYSAKQLCEMYEIDYEIAQTKVDLKNILSTFYDMGDKPKLLEILTPPALNDTVLKEYFSSI